MNILYITVRSDFGGGPKHVNQLIEKLCDKYNIYVAAPINEPYGILWKQNSNIKDFFEIPFRKLDLVILLELCKFIKKNKIDIVHSHGNGAGYYSRLIKLIIPSVKVIHTFHGISDNYNSSVKKYIHTIFGRIFKLLTDQFVLVSYGEYKLALERKLIKEKSSHIIYNGIESPNCSKSENRNIFNIVTISRFDYPKNMDFAYQIAEKLKDNKNIVFTWIGNGDDYERLKSFSEKNSINIQFTGFQPEPIKYLTKASLYLSTSRFEGLPYALIEAASLSIPILATNVKGNNEVVKNGYNGYLFNTLDECVGLILKLYNDKKLCNELSLNSKKYFQQNFTLDEMLNKLMNLYNKYIN